MFGESSSTPPTLNVGQARRNTHYSIGTTLYYYNECKHSEMVVLSHGFGFYECRRGGEVVLRIEHSQMSEVVFEKSEKQARSTTVQDEVL